MTAKLVTVLEELTMRWDLRFLTLLSWKGMIYDRGLFRSDRAWCPILQADNSKPCKSHSTFPALVAAFRQLCEAMN